LSLLRPLRAADHARTPAVAMFIVPQIEPARAAIAAGVTAAAIAARVEENQPAFSGKIS
jgi:hypothetical protein